MLRRFGFNPVEWVLLDEITEGGDGGGGAGTGSDGGSGTAVADSAGGDGGSGSDSGTDDLGGSAGDDSRDLPVSGFKPTHVSDRHEEFRAIVEKRQAADRVEQESLRQHQPEQRQQPPGQPPQDSKAVPAAKPKVPAAPEAAADKEGGAAGDAHSAGGHEHGDDLINLARAFGMADAEIAASDEPTLRRIVSVAGRNLFAARQSAAAGGTQSATGQAAVMPKLQPQPQADVHSGRQQDGQQAQQPPNLAALITALEQEGIDDGLLSAFRAVASETQQQSSLLADVHGYLQRQAEQRFHQDRAYIDSAIERLGDTETFGSLNSFSDSQAQAAGAVGQHCLELMRATGLPLSDDLVQQAYFDLFGRQVQQKTRLAKAKAIQSQSRRRMGTPSQAAPPANEEFNGPTHLHPKFRAMWERISQENGTA